MQVDGDSGADLTPPADFDMAKFDRGRHFFRNNLFSCCIGMFYALIIGLCFPDFLKILVLTNNSETPRKAHQRYVSTFKHIASWHYGNVWKKGSQAQKSILVVRNIHKKVRNELASNGQGHSLSQYNMMLVQSAFIVFPLLYTQQFGIKCSILDLDDYVYFWYGIGHLLGINAEYNICSRGMVQAIYLCKQIQENVIMPNLKNPCEDFYLMSNALVLGWNRYLHGTLSVPFVIAFFQSLTNKKRKNFGLLDKIRSLFWTLLFAAVRNVNYIKKILNAGIEKEFGLRFLEFFH